MIVAPARLDRILKLDHRSSPMKPLSMFGVLLLILGALAFVIPVPHRDDHSLKVGDAKVSLQTESREKLPPAVGIILIGGGVLSLVLGLRKS
jgi:hypothetical protein